MIIQKITPLEINQVAELFSEVYFHDAFFIWCVNNEKDRLKVVKEYYKVYLESTGAKTFVAKDENKIIGACLWLPHDCDLSIYEKIAQVALQYAPQFNEVAGKSHENEPKNTPFYQLVGFGTLKSYQGKGIGKSLLAAALTGFDQENVPTYLEASTPFNEKSIYAHFDYHTYSDTMKFTNEAILYPLFRKSNPTKEHI
ncbi:MAG: GNAT family N-acetyltransferase [Streptococcaceae bacterium]|jgi:GNAT superfamily N-acetyltransferase|nr:GNAT family N-acetyltransferase [Streptococcaceae bacterium]